MRRPTRSPFHRLAIQTLECGEYVMIPHYAAFLRIRLVRIRIRGLQHSIDRNFCFIGAVEVHFLLSSVASDHFFLNVVPIVFRNDAAHMQRYRTRTSVTVSDIKAEIRTVRTIECR